MTSPQRPDGQATRTSPTPAPEHDHHHSHEHPTGWRGLVGSVFGPHSHDVSDSMDSALESSSRGLRTLGVSLAVLLVTGLVQGVIAASSGSVALLADTVHNVADALTAIPLGFAFWLSRRPPTRRFPYGYGRAEDLAGLFIVLVIALSAVFAAWQAFHRLVAPTPIQHLGWVAAAGLVGFLGNESVAVYRIRVGRSIGSAALVADGVHARTDGLTSLAVVVGATGVALGFPLADPLVGLLITVAISTVLWGAARDVFGRLMDAVDPDLLTAGRAALEGTDEVQAVTDLRMRWSGHQLLADATLDVEPDLSLTAAHQVAHAAEENLIRSVPRLSDAVIHAQPGTVRR